MKQLFVTKKVNRKWYGDVIVFLLLAGFGIFMALPLVFSTVQSLKPMDELFLFPPRFFVMRPTFDNYITLSQVFSNFWVPFSRYVFNSVFVSFLVTVSSVVIASMCAYPLAKHQFYGKNMIFRVITFALLFAGGVTSLPLYIILSRLGLVNTYFALVLPQIASPLGLFLMCQFMKVIPDELIEAAKLDGAKEVQILFRLVMPLVRPAWMTLVIFAFQAIWNVTGENLIYTENYKLLPSLMSQVAAAGLARAGAAAAAAFIMMVPPIVIFMISQKKVIETMSYSGLKG